MSVRRIVGGEKRVGGGQEGQSYEGRWWWWWWNPAAASSPYGTGLLILLPAARVRHTPAAVHTAYYCFSSSSSSSSHSPTDDDDDDYDEVEEVDSIRCSRCVRLPRASNFQIHGPTSPARCARAPTLHKPTMKVQSPRIEAGESLV